MNEMLKLDNQLCFRLYAASRNMTRLYQPFLNKYNLTYPQYIIMLVMFEHNSIDFKELSKVVDLKTGTLTPILQNLEKLGYINRNKNSKDQRKINIDITDKGLELEKQILDVPVGMASDLEITEDMYHTLVKELDSLSNILKTVSQSKNNE
jgi:DNA-binding MarR family transcriptional regulator